jgi:hypothetical protein
MDHRAVLVQAVKDRAILADVERAQLLSEAALRTGDSDGKSARHSPLDLPCGRPQQRGSPQHGGQHGTHQRA